MSKPESPREQAISILKRLDPKHVYIVLPLLIALEEAESWEATAELDAIPGLFEEFERARAAVARGETVRWEDIKGEV